MTQSTGYIFVLWTTSFDEVVAAIFVTECRRLGLAVRVVGLTQRRLSGAFGLILYPDLNLEQALPLAWQAAGVVIPSTISSSKRLGEDYRLREFLHRAYANQAQFMIGPLSATDLTLFPPDAALTRLEPGSSDAITIARRMAQSIMAS